MSNSTKLRVRCESYNVVEGTQPESGKKKVTLEGTALVFGKPTRNKVFYTLESARRTLKSWIGRPFLNSHDDSNVLNSMGHVEDMQMGKDKIGRDIMQYKVDVDPEEKDFIRKAKRKDIPFVSIQVLVDEVRQQENLEFGQYIEADIREGLELSSVLIPGDGETNGIITEKTLVERFLGKTIKEQITDKSKKDNEEEKPLDRKNNSGIVGKPPYEEDLTTASGDGIIENPALAKKIKKTEEPKTKITPDGVPAGRLEANSTDIDDVLAKKTNLPDETQEEQEITYTRDGKTIPYYKKGGNNIPPVLPKGFKIEKHSIWNHCKRPMFVAKNSAGNTIIQCKTCGKQLKENKKYWNRTKEQINKKYKFVKMTKAIRRN